MSIRMGKIMKMKRHSTFKLHSNFLKRLNLGITVSTFSNTFHQRYSNVIAMSHIHGNESKDRLISLLYWFLSIINQFLLQRNLIHLSVFLWSQKLKQVQIQHFNLLRKIKILLYCISPSVLQLQYYKAHSFPIYQY